MYTSKFKMTLPVQEAGTLKKSISITDNFSFFKDNNTVLSLVILEKTLATLSVI